MKERNWKYKINGGWPTLIMASVMLAIFGGITVWLYTTRNGAFIGGLIVTACMAIGFILSVCSVLFFKVFVDKDGFFCQTAPGNGRYYRYSDMLNMWLSSGRETDTQEATYCNFETIEGKRSRFLVLDPHLDAVDYMIERVEAVGSRRGDDDFDREIVITGKTESVVIIILVIFGFPILYLMLFGWTTMPLIFRMIPVAILLFSIVRAFSHGLFYMLKIQKDGFYCRTNPLNGRYYRYSDILDCCLVESQRNMRRSATRYGYYMKFTDCENQTHRVPYNKSLYEGEIDELVARIKRAKEDEA